MLQKKKRKQYIPETLQKTNRERQVQHIGEDPGEGLLKLLCQDALTKKGEPKKFAPGTSGSINQNENR